MNLNKLQESIMHLDNYIRQLAIELEFIDELLPSEHGLYALPIEEGLVIFVRSLQQGQGLYFFAPLFAYPDKDEENLLMDLMSANLFGQQTGQTVLALDQEGEQFTLSWTEPYNMSYYEFYDALELFTNYASYWKKYGLQQSQA